MNPEQLQPNKIYSITWTGTQIVGRYKEVKCKETKEHTFYDCLHYWNKYENFYQEESVLLSNHDELKEASKAEKTLLTRYEIENNLI